MGSMSFMIVEILLGLSGLLIIVFVLGFSEWGWRSVLFRLVKLVWEFFLLPYRLIDWCISKEKPPSSEKLSDLPHE